MTPVLIVIINHLSKINSLPHIRLRWNVRGSEVPDDSPESAIVGAIFRGNILFLVRVHGTFFVAHCRARHMSLLCRPHWGWRWNSANREDRVLCMVMVQAVAIVGASASGSVHRDWRITNPVEVSGSKSTSVQAS